ncbi:MAG: SRPBCC family protein [Egibacteraceae bacterium]
MKVSGHATVAMPVERTWAALTDPAVLARTLPGCRELTEVAPGEYRATVHAGVASTRGLFTGKLALTDQVPPSACTLRISGQGAPGTIEATVRVTLASDGDAATRIDYDADAVVGGAIAGVGQRVLAGVAKRNAEQFFTAVGSELARPPAAEPQPPPAAAPITPAGTPVPGTAGAPAAAARVFPGREPTAATPPAPLLMAALVGAVIALAGVLVGRRFHR